MSEQSYRSERSLGYVQLTPITASTQITVPLNASQVLVTIEGQAVRYRDDGANPTSTVGMPLAVGASLRYTGAQISQLRFIEQAVGGIVNMTFYG